MSTCFLTLGQQVSHVNPQLHHLKPNAGIPTRMLSQPFLMHSVASQDRAHKFRGFAVGRTGPRNVAAPSLSVYHQEKRVTRGGYWSSIDKNSTHVYVYNTHM